MINKTGNDLGRALKRQRQMLDLTLSELVAASGVSPSHLGRIENGSRRPSASVLKSISAPLGFEVEELFSIAGFFSPRTGDTKTATDTFCGRVDPYVCRMLAGESPETQRAVIGILSIMKSLSGR